MNRRDFILHTSLATSALWVPQFLGRLGHRDLRGNKILIVIQLSGGNDGLNTFVPFEDDVYYRSRPGLAIDKNKVLPLSAYQGLHPAFAPLRQLYDNGMLSILNSIGYPNPDRSHFRSMDIWHAGKLDERTGTGWLGRYLDHACDGCAPHFGIEIGEDLSLAVQGNREKALVLENPRQLRKSVYTPHIARLATGAYQNGAQGDLDFLYKTLAETRQSAAYLATIAGERRSRGSYPRSPIGRDLRLVADLILGGSETAVYFVSQTGYDTHVRQQAQQSRQLSQLAQALVALVTDLESNRLMEDVLILSFSEFGRRVEQNASGGTDHGAGNNAFLISRSLRKTGFYNAPPDLKNLIDGDVHYTLDFRRLYAEILENWLGQKPANILGATHDTLDLL